MSTTPVTFTLTHEDIAVNRHSCGNRCAIARAAKRVLPNRFAWVTRRRLLLDVTRIDEDGYPIDLATEVEFPPEVLHWHNAFMDGQPVEPISFTLDIPAAPATP